MTRFDVTGLPTTFTEGNVFNFMLTPVSALGEVIMVRWEIILDGQLAASSGFFSALSGTVDFSSGATAPRTVIVTLNDDMRRSEDRSFNLRLVEVASGTETQMGKDHVVVVVDNDISQSFPDIDLPNSAAHDTFVVGSGYTYASASGAAGDDTFVITKHQRGDVEIDDTLGSNIIKFDEDVEITHVDQSSRSIRGNVVITSLDLTLETGAVITIPSPASVTGGIHRYRYQLGDGEVQTYADFHAELVSGGFVAGSTTELATPIVITNVDGRDSNQGGGSTYFDISTLADMIAEGDDYNFILTPVSALGEAVSVRWEIILCGQLAASSGFFPVLSGTVDFSSGATAPQIVTITVNDDTRRSEDRSFNLRLVEVASGIETQIGEDHVVIVVDNDISQRFPDIDLPSSGAHDTFVVGSGYTYASASGAAGDDTFIITKHQRGDAEIDDTLGSNIIKFDEGVEITHVDQSSRSIRGNVVITGLDLTLETGAVITIPSPASVTGGMHRYRYQLGDGEVQTYASFHAELVAGGFVAGSTTELATPIVITNIDEGDANFTITSNSDITTPTVGDVLTVTLDTADPDGNGDGILTYQWFVVDGLDIIGATEATYTIVDADQTIGVRVSYTDSDGFAETVTTELSVASAYNVIQDGDGHGADTLAGTSADDLILGGNNDDTITSGGGDDIVIGGYGRDEITLSDDGAETVIYRFSSKRVTDTQSNTGWIAIDGADMVHNFDRGTDKLVLVDVDGTPIDLAGFLAGTSSVNVNPIFDSSDDNVLIGVTFQFISNGFPDGSGNGGPHSGRWFTLFYKEEDKVTVYNDDGTTTDEGAKFVGEDGALLDTSHIRSNRHYLTDLSLLPNYFQASDEGFSDGLQVIASSELGVGNDPVITSGGTATALVENTEVEITTTVYTATGVFDLIPIIWSLRGDDSNLFSIDETSGEVTFKAATTPDHETKSSYSFTVVAMSGSRESDMQVTIEVTDINEALVITLDATALVENAEVDTSTVVYTATGTFDLIAIVWSLKVGTDDSNLFNIDETSGEVTFKAATTPDYEVKDSYAFTIVATSGSLSTEQVVTIAVTDVVDEGDATFTIVSDGSVDTPLVGDELTVTLGVTDPDGNGDGVLTYQWFVVGGDDIAGAIEASYTITEAGQTIGVRVTYTDGGDTVETVSTVLSVASVTSIVDRSDYTLLKTGDGGGADTFAGTSADDLILGGNNDDTITTGGGDDVVIAGYGRDTVTLSDDDAETIVYRFSSSDATGWTATDGADTVTSFDRGVDKLVLVDVDADTPVNRAGFLGGIGSFNVNPIFDSSDDNVLMGVTFQFIGEGFPDGLGNGGTNSGRWFTLFYKEEDKVTVYNDDGSTTDEGAKFVGENGALLDTDSDSRSNRHYLTDLSILSNYFGEGFADGLQVIELSELGVDTNPVITSGETATALIENTEVETSIAVYTATGTFDLTPIVWSLKAGNGDDAALFSIDSATGAVTFKAATTPDYETKSSYSFTVVATSGSLSSEKSVTIAVTDVADEGDARYIIDDVNTGAVEHITDASSLGEGSILYARLSSDDSEGNGVPTYQWKRGSVDIASATAASYFLTAADLGRTLTVIVSYTDSRGTEESVTSAAVTIPASVSADQASFTITSDGKIDTPLVGDELTVTRSIDDPDGNGDGVLTYQWFVVDGADIIGATEASYTITEADQTIGVRVIYIDGGGSTEIVTTVLNVASVTPIIVPSAYTLVKTGDGSGEDALAGTSADDLIQGGDDADTITTGGGGDVVIGGYGADTITLSDDGAETVVYRFSSSGASGWTATDGGDTINNFDRGVDKLMFVDVDTDTPVDLTSFLQSEAEFDVEIMFNADDSSIIGIIIRFPVEGYSDGSSTDAEAGKSLTINYKNSIGGLIINFNTLTDEGAKFFGKNFASFRLNDQHLTDFSLLPNYFGENFDDGLQVIKSNELGVDIL